MEDILLYFVLFMIYSFIGWLIEICCVALETKKVINRGFLIGPYCPIYGFGAIMMTIFLRNYTDDIFGIFLKSVFICAILEYVTSYIMEKLFKTRWWDYSNNKFNINGRVCLETLVLFGIGGCVIMKATNPVLFFAYDAIPNIILLIVAVIFFIIFLTDVIISFNIINNFKKNFITIKKDSTEEVNNRVREVLDSKSYLKKRILRAFPNLNRK